MFENPEILRDVIIIFYNQFYKEFGYTNDRLDQSLERFRKTAELAKTDKKHLRGLNLAVNDVLQMVSASSPKEKLKFSKAIKSKVNISILELEGKITAQVKRIVKKGKISDEYEYYLIKEAAEKAFEDGENDEIEKFNKMIIAFEDSQ